MGYGTVRVWAGAVAALWLAASVAGCGPPRGTATVPPPQEPPLIARADLFGDPARTDAQLSPRGDRIAFVAPRDGTQNIWVMAVGAAAQPQPVTDDHGRGVQDYAWAHDNRTILYLQDEQGDENRRLFAVDTTNGQSRALTPAGSRAELLGLSASDAQGAIVSLNERDRAWPDVYRYDIASGERTLVQRNVNNATSRGFASFVVDHENRLRLGTRTLPDGGEEMWVRSGPNRWTNLFTIPFEDVQLSRPLGFEAGARSFLMLDSTGRDRAALVRVDAATGARTVIGESPRADVVDVWLHPATNAPEAFAADYLRHEWRAIDQEAQADVDFLDAQLQGEPRVVSRSADDKKWIVVEDGATTPAVSYLYDRSDGANRRLTLLFRHRPALERMPLQPMTPREIEARDGLTLVSYLTLPIGSDANGDSLPDRPAPLVLLAHSGPWSRDSYGYNAMHQWLANRGYAVLSVNFRGSTGFGKAFLNAGNREWGGRMQDDLLDAVQWAVENGIAKPDRVAIMGSAYGGYAALAGLAFTPERFACGVSFDGVANLASLFDTAQMSSRDELYLRVGDPRTGEGRQMLRERSPLTSAGDIRRPLMMALGLRDPRASRGEADAIAANLRGRRTPLVYFVYPDEGRMVTRTQNRLAYFAIAEHFLGQCLGGRVEPVGAAFQGASIQAIDGAASVPGLSAFVRRAAAPTTTTTIVAPDDGAGGPAADPAPPEGANTPATTSAPSTPPTTVTTSAPAPTP